MASYGLDPLRDGDPRDLRVGQDLSEDDPEAEYTVPQVLSHEDTPWE